MNLTIGYLYGDCMNIYGDTGNIICLTKRAEWRGIDVKVKNISLKDKLKPKDIDIFFFGGGQDQAQELVSKDLVTSNKGQVIREEVERGVPLLSICGGYQLLGDYYQPQNGPKLPGIGLFQAHTTASDQRMIGNIIVEAGSRGWGVDNKKSTSHEQRANYYLVGFENHSGKTYLEKGAIPLGKVIKGFGNNGEDETEGCVYKNAIGCYMHGSLLPKNPTLADFLITKALEVKYGKTINLKVLDDTLEQNAHLKVFSKFS